MAIYPIGQAPRVLTSTPGLSAPASPQSGEMDFPGMLQKVLGNLNDLAQRADSQATQAAAGDDVDLHQVVIAMEAAGLGFQLALQVRNKLLEAYQEIIRMQV